MSTGSSLTAARLEPGSAYPLGAHWDGHGTNFALFSAHAEAVELCLFDDSGKHETARLRLPECTNGIWHGYLPNARAGQLYGYRVQGPYRPEEGHRFNPNTPLEATTGRSASRSHLRTTQVSSTRRAPRDSR